jgi:hypothetical protein
MSCARSGRSTAGEDANRIQQRIEAANFSMRRRIALSLLKKKPSKHGIKVKRLMAALDPDFLAKILFRSQILSQA